MTSSRALVPKGTFRRPLNAAGTASLLRQRLGPAASLALVLGSGLDAVAAKAKLLDEISYSLLPGFPETSVPGHAGKLILGQLGGWPVLILAGRAHFYEGRAIEDVVFPIRTLAEYGVKDIVLTNAAGGIRRSFRAGNFMIVKDHINFMGINPLRGYEGDLDRFVDLSRAYDPSLQVMLKKAARAADIPLHEGVYLAVSGPSYETPAEIRAFRKWGADAVGMSTVPEVIAARQHGLQVAALSCITNPAAGRRKAELSHEEVVREAARASASLAILMEGMARIYRDEPR